MHLGGYEPEQRTRCVGCSTPDDDDDDDLIQYWIRCIESDEICISCVASEVSDCTAYCLHWLVLSHHPPFDTWARDIINGFVFTTCSSTNFVAAIADQTEILQAQTMWSPVVIWIMRFEKSRHILAQAKTAIRFSSVGSAMSNWAFPASPNALCGTS